jgi:hypothetical protein
VYPRIAGLLIEHASLIQMGRFVGQMPEAL